MLQILVKSNKMFGARGRYLKTITMARKKERDQYVVEAVLLVEANVQCSNRGAYQCYTSG
jgi:hypothetical protein